MQLSKTLYAINVMIKLKALSIFCSVIGISLIIKGLVETQGFERKRKYNPTYSKYYNIKNSKKIVF